MKGKTTKRHDRQRKLATALILSAMGAVAAEPAHAQDLQQISDERIEFDIAAQPLSSALSEYARQARVNALYFSDDLRGLSSPALRGSYTRQQALDLLLAHSGYNGRINGGRWSIPLRAMPGADAAGSAGLTGDVDAHIGRIVLASLISAVLGVAANESEDEDDARLSQSIGDAAAQQAAQTGSRIVDRELNVRPTLRIRAGARVRVLVSQDIQLRPYPP